MLVKNDKGTPRFSGVTLPGQSHISKGINELAADAG